MMSLNIVRIAQVYCCCKCNFFVFVFVCAFFASQFISIYLVCCLRFFINLGVSMYSVFALF